MKKTLLTILLGVFGAMVFVTPALAATSVSFTPVNMSVRQGQAFILTIGINPQGTKNYTIKTEFSYPADLLEVKSFTFANSWMPIAQPGYDLIDNTNGVLIKTAGYPGGVSSAITFGTVSFLAKKSGNGTIALNSDSFALDANNKNVLSGTPTVSVKVTALASVPTQPSTQQTITSSPESEEPEVADTVTLQPTEQPPEPQASLLAAAGSILTLGTGITWLGILVGLVILVVMGYAIYSLIRRKQRNLS